jgi:hypothetical protein
MGCAVCSALALVSARVVNVEASNTGSPPKLPAPQLSAETSTATVNASNEAATKEVNSLWRVTGARTGPRGSD